MKNRNRASPQGLFILPKYFLCQIVSLNFSIACPPDIHETTLDLVNFKKQLASTLPKFSLCSVVWVYSLYESFTERLLERRLRALCIRTQIVVTAEVKRCFRSRRAVQPSSASTKYCLCTSYFQSVHDGVLFSSREKQQMLIQTQQCFLMYI